MMADKKLLSRKPLDPKFTGPVGLNLKRAGWAEVALEAFSVETGMDGANEDRETVLGDLLGDLMHNCDLNVVDFNEVLEKSRRLYEQEIKCVCKKCKRRHDPEGDSTDEKLCIECDPKKPKTEKVVHPPDDPEEHYTSIMPYQRRHKAALCDCQLVREESGRVKLMMCRKHQAADEEKFVLTTYVDGGGMIQFHAGPKGDFKQASKGNFSRMLRTFTIAGKILSEDGETEPIRV